MFAICPTILDAWLSLACCSLYLSFISNFSFISGAVKEMVDHNVAENRYNGAEGTSAYMKWPNVV